MSEQKIKQIYAAIFSKLDADQMELITNYAEQLLDEGSVANGFFGISYPVIVSRLFFNGKNFADITESDVASFNSSCNEGLSCNAPEVETVADVLRSTQSGCCRQLNLAPLCATVGSNGRGFNTSQEVFAHLAAGGKVAYRDGTVYNFDRAGRLCRNGERVARKDALTFAYQEAWNTVA